jgi:hypothetical protein
MYRYGTVPLPGLVLGGRREGEGKFSPPSSVVAIILLGKGQLTKLQSVESNRSTIQVGKEANSSYDG